MGILVYVEGAGKAGLAAIGLALEAKAAHGYDKVTALLCGNEGIEDTAKNIATSGVDEVVYVKSAALERYLALPYAAAIKSVLEQVPSQTVVFAATSLGKDLAPRVAHHLQAGQASDVIAVLPGGGFRRLMYAGNVVADIEVLTANKIVTVRAAAVEAAKLGGPACAVRELNVHVADDSRQKFVSFDTVKSERPELQDAEIVVSGGRAMKSAENFEKYIAPLADAFGAAIGASRAAVDSGYAPNDWQVGQTGKVVAPKLYVAVGISGAIQHLAGMKDSKVIVAINKDPDAPIFEIADYGLVADLFEAVPELTEAVKRAKGS